MNDVIVLGEVSIDFLGEQIGSSLSQMLSFKKYVGGFGGLFAIASSRLGLKSAILSQIGQDEMGKAIIEGLKRENVDTTHLHVHPNLKSNVRIRAIQSKQSFPCEEYGENGAYWAFNGEQIDLDTIINSKLLCIQSKELNTHLNHAIRKAMIAAKDHQIPIALYLSKYIAETALPLCSFIFVNEHELTELFLTHSKMEALQLLRNLTPATILVKNNSGCYAFTHHIPTDLNLCYYANPSNVESYFEENVLEAFSAGFIAAFLKQAPLAQSCQQGLYCAQIMHSRHSHSDALPTQEEIALFSAQENQIVVQTLKSHYFEHLHYVAKRPKHAQHLFSFSYGYHEQWTKIATRFKVSEENIYRAKLLIAQGLAKYQGSELSIICDEMPKPDLLELFSNNWIARTVEAPNEIPLRILSDETSNMLLQWPQNQGAKVTIIYHPDDKYVLRGQQENTLNLLYRACRTTHHELLIEISPPSSSLLTPSTYAHIIRRFYEIGIYPDWWQIAAPRDIRSWETIAKIVEESDKHCAGILISAQHAPAGQLKLLFQNHACYPLCKGFVIGRNIIQQPLENWLAQKIADTTFVENVQSAFEQVIEWYKLAQQNKNPKASVVL